MESIHVKWIIVFAILVMFNCLSHVLCPRRWIVLVKKLRLEGSPKLNLDHLSGRDKNLIRQTANKVKPFLQETLSWAGREMWKMFH